jgi:hypothetical protein
MSRITLFRRSLPIVPSVLTVLLLSSTTLVVGCGDQKDPTPGSNDDTSEPDPTTDTSSSDEPTATPNPANGSSSLGETMPGSEPTTDTGSAEPSAPTTEPSSTTEEPGTSQPPSSDELCPAKDGATWTYYHSGGGGWTEVQTVTIAEYDGASTLLFSDTPNPSDDLRSDSYHVKEDGRLLRVYKEQFWVNPANGEETLDSSATYGEGFLRCDDAWASKEIGYTESPSYDRVETIAGQAPKPSEERKHTFTVEARENITTENGLSFTDCVKVRRGKDWAAVTGEDVEEKLYWFCPGVGKVREENVTSGNYEELTEYSIPE